MKLSKNLLLEKPIKVASGRKKLVDKAIRAIAQNPEIGQLKKENLSGLSVYKFKVNKQQKLLAYMWDKKELFLTTMGAYENFYQDLKRASDDLLFTLIH